MSSTLCVPTSLHSIHRCLYMMTINVFHSCSILPSPLPRHRKQREKNLNDELNWCKSCLEFLIKGNWEQGQIWSGTGSPPRRTSQRTLFLLGNPLIEQNLEKCLFFFFPMQKDADNSKGITNSIKPWENNLQGQVKLSSCVLSQNKQHLRGNMIPYKYAWGISCRRGKSHSFREHNRELWSDH